MRNKNIAKLVTASFNKNNQLDKNSVDIIASKLKRKELKEYIRQLKKFEKSNKLIVELSFEPTEENKKEIRDNFPGKNVEFSQTPELVFGMKIIDNDKIYDLNIKNTLDQLEEYIDKQYD